MQATAGTLAFTEPLWLIGAAGALGPMLAHWWSNRPGRPVRFPAVEMLAAVERRTTRRRELTDALLLTMRCAAVALVAMAFARPTWGVADQTAADRPTDRRTVAVVLDASGSMRQRVRGGTAFEAARREAAAFVRSLDAERDRAAVIVAGDRIASIWSEPTTRFDALAEQVEVQPVTDAFVNLRDAAQRAHGIAGPNAEVHVFTDGQAAAWPEPPDDRFTLHRFAGESRSNVAIESVRTEPGVVVVGRPIELLVTVNSYADAAVEAIVRVVGIADSEPRSVTLAGGERQVVRLPFIARRATPLDVRVTVDAPGDVLPTDDSVIHRIEPRRAIAVAVTPWAEALVSVIEPSNRSPFAAEALRPRRLHESTADLWVVSGSPELLGISRGAIADAETIDERIRRGTGVLIVDPSLDLPWAPARAAGQLDPARLNPVSLSLGVLPAFDDGQAAALLADLPIADRVRIEPRPGAEVLLHFTDGEPAIITWAYGRGRVIQLAFPVTGRGGAEALGSPVLLPLVHELLHRLFEAESAAARPAIDPRERDLALLEAPGDRASSPRASATAASATLTESPAPLWPGLLIGAIILLTVECLVAGRLAERRGREAAA